ncbi:MAG TPA: NAD-dependent succinate-semialdehyde dehydrogenase, partial [Nannocystaceae bacterium]|nr:NAD-dependent succinate-semialdehyde dehydrogenase [Nannocystaceae bacterium]
MVERRNLIGGQWIDAHSGARMNVVDPATDELVATVPSCGAGEARAAVDAASAAWPQWRARTAGDRATLLRKFAAAVLERADELARTMVREGGKPLGEARGEMVYAASFLSVAADEATRTAGDLVPSSHADKRILALRQPVGVAVAITPWNVPAAMITRKLGPALAVGCPMIVKPAGQTPLTALALGEIAQAVGFPPGVVQVITGKSSELVQTWFADPRVRKVSFTGSTEVGRTLVRQSADNITRLSLELGGHAPFLVFDDADVDAAVRGAMANKFRNSGQTCICANRFYVQSGIYDELVAKLERAMKGLVLGHGLDEGVTIGPLIDDDGVRKVQRHVDDARAHGAKIRMGGHVTRPRPGLTERFYQPTIVDGFGSDMLLAHEETFGPVVPIRRFTDEREVIELANDSPFGLAAYLFARDVSRVFRVAEALEYGIVGVNDGAPSTAQAPFGGMKTSGLGREGGRWGLDAYLET